MSATETTPGKTTAERPDVPSGPPRPHRAASPLVLAEKYGLVVLLVATIVVFSVISKTADLFATRANLNNILGGEVTLCVVAIAFTLPLMVGKLDLSVAAIAGLASVGATAAMSRHHAPLVVAILVALLIGLVVGMVNGFLIAVLHLDSIIVTLAGMTLIAGVVQWYTKGLSINTGISTTLTNFGSLQLWGIPRITFLLVILTALVWYVIEWTPFGRYLRMIGSNSGAARLVGTAVDRNVFLTFAVTGLLAGVGGVLLTARSGGANPQDGPGLLLPALAAVYLGATTIQPGRFNVLGTILGVFFVAVAVSGLTLAGVPPYVEQLFNGGALMAAVGLSRVFGKARAGGTIGT
jgi:ribose transport system permease protein